MDEVWAVLAAALGSSLLTGAIALMIAERQANHQRDAITRQERREAYSMLLARSGMVMHRAHALHLTMKFRSGLDEGVGIAVGARKQLDPLDLFDQMRDDLEPIYEAWSAIWAIGSQEAIAAANTVVDQAARVVGAATRRGEARQGILRALAGEKWTVEQLDAWRDQERRLAAERRTFALVARAELGSPVAEVFTEVTEPELDAADEP